MKEITMMVVLEILLGLVLMYAGLWWGVVLSAAVASLIFAQLSRPKRMLWSTAAGVVLWTGWNMVHIANGGDVILGKMGTLFQTGPIGLMLVSALIGGLLALSGALAGSWSYRSQ